MTITNLTLWSTALDKLTVKKVTAINGTQMFIKMFTRSIPGPYCEPNIFQINEVHTLPPMSCNVHYNITLPPTPRSSKWSLRPNFLNCTYLILGQMLKKEILFNFLKHIYEYKHHGAIVNY
jgi:hypothetical protein